MYETKDFQGKNDPVVTHSIRNVFCDIRDGVGGYHELMVGHMAYQDVLEAKWKDYMDALTRI